MAMKCQALAAQIEEIQPAAAAHDVARLCLLLTAQADNLERLADPQRLSQAWHDMGLRLQAASDQHAAMAMELEELAGLSPREFTEDHIWTLIRAIKVQSQLLKMYLGRQSS